MYSQSILDNLRVTSCSLVHKTLVNISASTQCLLFGLGESRDVIENMGFGHRYPFMGWLMGCPFALPVTSPSHQGHVLCLVLDGQPSQLFWILLQACRASRDPQRIVVGALWKGAPKLFWTLLCSQILSLSPCLSSRSYWMDVLEWKGQDIGSCSKSTSMSLSSFPSDSSLLKVQRKILNLLYRWGTRETHSDHPPYISDVLFISYILLKFTQKINLILSAMKSEYYL